MARFTAVDLRSWFSEPGRQNHLGFQNAPEPRPLARHHQMTCVCPTQPTRLHLRTVCGLSFVLGVKMTSAALQARQ